MQNSNSNCIHFIRRNHIIGLPQRDAVNKPLYDYEKIIFDSVCSSTNMS